MTSVEFVTILVLSLVLIIGSFIAGLKLSDWYHRQAEQERQYALEKQFLRLRAGVDFDDPSGPYISRHKNPLPPEFEERLRKNGRATVSLNPNS